MYTTNSKCAPRRIRMAPLRIVGPVSMVLCLITLQAWSAPLPRFEMTAVVDVPGGEQIVRSDYAAAVDIIANAPRTASRALSAFQSTNLCVAHTMIKQSAAAVRFCNEAIEREKSRLHYGETRSERTPSSRGRTPTALSRCGWPVTARPLKST